MAFCRSNLSALASSSWHSASGFWIFPGNVPSDEPEVDFELFSHLSGTSQLLCVRIAALFAKACLLKRR
ncbi:hypothetical protein IH879_11770 [candidate division KSB1 bacterium]|nr:hypothetical protein [candidate division KSB1 bacterium]